jgi:hypothetical protein
VTNVGSATDTNDYSRRQRATHLPETVLPEDHVRGDTVLSVVHEDDHAVRVHGLSGEELVVLEVSDHLLGEGTGGGLEGGETGLGVLVTGVGLGLEGSLGLLHVSLEVGKVRLDRGGRCK